MLGRRVQEGHGDAAVVVDRERLEIHADVVRDARRGIQVALTDLVAPEQLRLRVLDADLVEEVAVDLGPRVLRADHHGRHARVLVRAEVDLLDLAVHGKLGGQRPPRLAAVRRPAPEELRALRHEVVEPPGRVDGVASARLRPIRVNDAGPRLLDAVEDRPVVVDFAGREEPIRPPWNIPPFVFGWMTS